MDPEQTYKDDRGRERCGRCRKLIYWSQRAAESAAEDALTRSLDFRVYYDERCSAYHLTSQPERVAMPGDFRRGAYVPAAPRPYAPRLPQVPEPEPVPVGPTSEEIEARQLEDARGCRRALRLTAWYLLILPFWLPSSLMSRAGVWRPVRYALAVAFGVMVYDILCEVFLGVAPVRQSGIWVVKELLLTARYILWQPS